MTLQIKIPKRIYHVKLMTAAEREAAFTVDRRKYPQECPCMVCGHRWMQHKGEVCPSTPGGFLPSGGIVLPSFGFTRFIPDEDFYKPPDFDVI